MKSIILSLAVALLLGTLLCLGMSCFQYEEAALPQPTATATPDWYTSNETLPPGDWDDSCLYQAAVGAAITRTDVQYKVDTYSYQHYAQANAGTCWSASQLTCTVPVTAGAIDLYARFHQYEGGDEEDKSFASISKSSASACYGEFYRLRIALDVPERRAYVFCNMCDPDAAWPMGHVGLNKWHHYRLEWDLPRNTSSGAITATMDGKVWVQETGLTVEDNDPCNLISTGVIGWHHLWADYSSVWIDAVTVEHCDEPWPTPTPTPIVDCPRYGHAAVVNVDSNCSGVLRFKSVIADVPEGAIVSRATLRIYGIADDSDGDTIYVTKVNALWGEANADWCNRTRADTWNAAGATHVPFDRAPHYLATFTATTGWIDIEIPVGLVEQWAQTGAANPGLIFHNENLSGRFAFASREWHTEEYAPRLNVWYSY